jgi:hypothetical protein
MMIKDLEMHIELASDELAALRGGSNTILPGGCVDPIGPHVPKLEDLQKTIEKKIADLLKPLETPVPYYD